MEYLYRFYFKENGAAGNAAGPPVASFYFIKIPPVTISINVYWLLFMLFAKLTAYSG